MTDPTPRPWRVTGEFMTYVIEEQEEEFVCATSATGPHLEEGQANARLIVRAVNCHEALVGALQNIVAAVDAAGPRYVPDIVFRSAETARAALAKVEEES